MFLKEHSLEIELPFIQYVLGSGFKVVPILFGSRTITQAEKLGEILHHILKEKEGVLVVASSDLSHYHSENAAFYLDRRTLDFVKDNLECWNNRPFTPLEGIEFNPDFLMSALAYTSNVTTAHHFPPSFSTLRS